jgi:hypothetical protein
MDCRSYMSEEDWEHMMADLGYNTVNLRDSRYDCVIHLVTAADGNGLYLQLCICLLMVYWATMCIRH